MPDGAMLATGRSLVTRALPFDARDPELAELLRGDAAKHGYAYRPFTDGDVLGQPGTTAWQPQVVPSAAPHASRDMPPRVLTRLAASTQFKSMGLLPDIHRAWIALDRAANDFGGAVPPADASPQRVHELLLWDYDAPAHDLTLEGGAMGGGDDGDPYRYSSVHVLSDFGSPILAAALVAPRGGRLTTSIARAEVEVPAKFVLVVTTRDAVKLFVLEVPPSKPTVSQQNMGTTGVGGGAIPMHTLSRGPLGARDAAPMASLIVHGDAEGGPLLSFSSDGVAYTCITGTPNGRILLGGSDGCVHEIVIEDIVPSTRSVGGSNQSSTFIETCMSASFAIGRMSLRGASWAFAMGDAEATAKRASIKNRSASSISAVVWGLLGGTPSAGLALCSLTHDHERGLLYSLAVDGTLHLYSTTPASIPMGSNAFAIAASRDSGDGGAWDGFRKVACIDDIDSAAITFIRSTTSGSNLNKPETAAFAPGKGKRYGSAAAAPQGAAPITHGWPLSSISVVPASESRLVHLIATSASGARFYFSTLTPQRYNACVVTQAAAAAALIAAPGAPPPPPPQPLAPGAVGRNREELVPGQALHLVHIRLPPPAVTPEEFRVGQAAADVNGTLLEPASASSVPPSDKNMRVHDARVGGQFALLPMERPSTAAPLLAGGVAIEREWVSILSRAYTCPKQGGAVAAAAAAALNTSPPPFAETVSAIAVKGRVCAIADLPTEPHMAMDAPFTPAGLLALPGGDAAPLPWDLPDVLCGVGCFPPNVAGERGAAVATAGAKRPREEDALRDAEDPLLRSGVTAPHWALVRRRLWGASPSLVPSAAPLSSFAWQHEPCISSRGWVILTQLGVTRFVVMRPIDQLARCLTRARLGNSALASATNHHAMGDITLADFRARLNPPEEFFSMLTALATGAFVHGHELPPGAPSQGSAAAIAALASRAFSLHRGRLFFPPAAATGGNNTRPARDVKFSMGFEGILWLVTRTLRPFWDAPLFMSPPGDTLPLGTPLRSELSGVLQLGMRLATSAVPPTLPQRLPLLPRFSGEEALYLADRCSSLCAFLVDQYELVKLLNNGGLDLTSQLGEIALGAGMARDMGFGALVEGEEQATASDARADTVEQLYAVSLFKLLQRSAQAALLMTAVADPANNVPALLFRLNSAAPAIPAPAQQPPQPPAPPQPVAAAASDALLLETAQRITWKDLIAPCDNSPSSTFAEGLFSRVLESLRGEGGSLGLTRRAGINGRRTVGNTGDAASRLAGLLRESCPDYFSEASQLRAAAQEKADAALREGVPPSDVAALVLESLELALLSVAAATPGAAMAAWPYLSQLVTTLRRLGAYSGVMVLLLAAAAAAAGGGDSIRRLPSDIPKTEAEEAALFARNNNNTPPVTTTGYRLACYRLLLETLDMVRLGVGEVNPVHGGNRVIAGGSPAPGASYVGTAGGGAAVHHLAESLSPIKKLHIFGGAGGWGADPAATDNARGGRTRVGGALQAQQQQQLQQRAFLLPASAIGIRTAGADPLSPAAAAALGTTALHVADLGGLRDAGANLGAASPSAARAFESLLTDSALNSVDALWHDTLYRWLLRADLRSVLLRIESPFLRTFLIHRFGDADLLLAFFLARREFGRAARLMRERADANLLSAAGADGVATAATSFTPIAKRVEYMELAVQHAQQAGGSSVIADRGVVGGSGDDAPILPHVIAEWATYARILSVQEMLFSSLRRVEASGMPIEGITPEELRQDVRTLQYDTVTAQRMLELGYHVYGLFDVVVALFDIIRPPPRSGGITVNRLYTLMLNATMTAVTSGSLNDIRFMQADALERARLAADAAGRDDIATLMAALVEVIHDLAARFWDSRGEGVAAVAAGAGGGGGAALDPGSRYAFPTSYIVQLVETNAARDGWPCDSTYSAVPGAGGSTYDWAWLSCRALERLPWHERAAAYGAACAAISSAATAPSRRVTARVFAHIVRAWAELIHRWLQHTERSEGAGGAGLTVGALAVGGGMGGDSRSALLRIVPQLLQLSRGHAATLVALAGVHDEANDEEEEEEEADRSALLDAARTTLEGLEAALSLARGGGGGVGGGAAGAGAGGGWGAGGASRSARWQ